MKKKILFLFSLFCFVLTGYSNSLSGLYPTTVKNKSFSFSFDVYYINIDTVYVLRQPSKGSINVNQNAFNYTAQNYDSDDTSSLVLLYTIPGDSTQTLYSDTLIYAFRTLGKANTQAAFYSSSGAMSAKFYNFSVSDSSNLTYKWDFGDNTFSNAVSPTHQYTTDGTFNVCLTAYSSVDSNTYCENTMVYDSSYLQAYSDVGYYYFPDTGVFVDVLDNDVFYNSVQMGIVSQGSYGTASVVNNMLYYKPDTFIAYGSDVVTYTINRNGVVDTAEVLVYMYINGNYGYCSPFFTFTTNNKVVDFSQSTICGTPNTVKSQTWYFGDGSTSTAKNPTHAYVNYGTYSVCIEVEDSFGLKSKSCYHIDVYDGRCKPEFGYTPGILKAEFLNMSHCWDAISYQWDFGDSTSSTDDQPVHVYSNSGQYNVCLTKFGLTDTIQTCKTISVYDTTVVMAIDDYLYLQYSNDAVEYKVTANDLIYNPSSIAIIGQPTLVEANVVNNNIEFKNKKFVFNGEETIQYSVCKGNTCDTANIYITLAPADKLSGCLPSIQYTIYGDSVKFEAIQNCSNGDTLVAFNWFFGDGGNSIDSKPGYTYKQPGLYYVYLTAIDSFGRIAFASEAITIVDSSINGGCVKAEDDVYDINFFSIGNRYNVIYNDKNVFIKDAYAYSIKDFNYGITYLDTFGQLMWLPDSGYKGCDTMLYVVYNRSNPSCADTGVVVYCFDNFATWCVDSTYIDTSYNCGNVDMPVCGCNGVEYKNACEAYTKGGIGFYLNGPCSNYVPSINLGQSSSSQLTLYNDETKKYDYLLDKANKPNLDVQLIRSFKELSPNCLSVKVDKSNEKLVFTPSKGCVGKTIVYATVCDEFGACNIDTLYVNVIDRKQTNIDANTINEVKIYPNPFSNKVNIEMGVVKNANVKVFNITGVEVYKGAISHDNAEIDLSGLTAGVYIVKVIDNNGFVLKIEKLLKD